MNTSRDVPTLTTEKICSRCHQSKPLAMFRGNTRQFRQCLECREYKRKLRRGEVRGGRPNFNEPRTDVRWLALCEFCPLPDCIRSEGDIAPVARHKITGCLIYEAAINGLEPEEAVDKLIVTPSGLKVCV